MVLKSIENYKIKTKGEREMKNKKIIIGKNAYSHKMANSLVTITKILAALLVLMGAIITLATFIFGIPFVLFGIFMFMYSKNLKKIINEQTKESDTEDIVDEKNTDIIEKTVSDTTKTTQEKTEAEKNYNLFLDFDDDRFLAYEYEENIAIPVLEMLTGNGGKTLEFVKEPDNEYDKNAVALILDGNKVGYLYKGKIQDMVNDWLKREEYFWGHINKVDVENGKATFKIAFYKDMSTLSMKVFKLTKITKKEDEFGSSRFENVSCCSNGDIVEYESSYETENYVVTDECGSELGELGAKAVEWIEENEDMIKFSRINNIEENDSGNYKADIEIYFKE